MSAEFPGLVTSTSSTLLCSDSASPGAPPWKVVLDGAMMCVLSAAWSAGRVSPQTWVLTPLHPGLSRGPRGTVAGTQQGRQVAAGRPWRWGAFCSLASGNPWSSVEDAGARPWGLPGSSLQAHSLGFEAAQKQENEPGLGSEAAQQGQASQTL